MPLFLIVYGIAFWLTISAYMAVFVPHRILKAFGRVDEAQFYLGMISRWIARLLIFSTGSRLYIEGREHIPVGQPYCFIGNHQSFADILTYMASTPEAIGFIAKDSLKSIPIIRTWMMAMGCYFLKRNSLKDGMKAILYGAQRVREGYPMVIFPEGTRSKGTQMLPFRRGGVKLATKSKALAVPVSIQGTYRLLEQKGHPNPTWIGVKFHPPIVTKGLTSEEEDQLPDRIYNIIQAGVHELEQRTPRR